MVYGICLLSLVPMRAEMSDKAEIVTQMLFGECYEVVAREGNWVRLQLATDGYQGWIDYKQHNPVTWEYYQNWTNTSHPRVSDLLQIVKHGNTQIPVGIGSYLPFYSGQYIRVGDVEMEYIGNVTNASGSVSNADVVKVAYSFMKAPYLWGGKSVFGIDCSGLTQQVFGLCGYQLPRDAYQQVSHGEEVHFVTQTQPGDLAFFSNDEGRIVHVGIVLEGQRIMHAHGEVRIDTLDHNGIYNADRKRYSHNLRIIKRISL